MAVEAAVAVEAAKAAGGEMAEAEAEAQLIAVHCNPTQIKTG
jgi:hypothetical protein